MLKNRSLFVLAGSVLVLAFFLVTAYLRWYDILVPNVFTALWTGTVAAFLGGMISVALSIGTADLQTKIPLMRYEWLSTSLRPIVGALCAIPIVFLIESNFLSLGAFAKDWTVVLACLATGFSERWFMKTMDNLLVSGVKRE
jgi:hypothetical protein